MAQSKIKPHIRTTPDGRKVLVREHNRNIKGIAKTDQKAQSKNDFTYLSFNNVDINKEFQIVSKQKLDQFLKNIEKINKKAENFGLVVLLLTMK